MGLLVGAAPPMGVDVVGPDVEGDVEVDVEGGVEGDAVSVPCSDGVVIS